jgi:hypothetical protein
LVIKKDKSLTAQAIISLYTSIGVTVAVQIVKSKPINTKTLIPLLNKVELACADPRYVSTILRAYAVRVNIDEGCRTRSWRKYEESAIGSDCIHFIIWRKADVFPVIAMTLLEASNRSIDYRSRLSMFY